MGVDWLVKGHSLTSIGFPAMAYLNHVHEQFCSFYLIDDSVVSYPLSPQSTKGAM